MNRQVVNLNRFKLAHEIGGGGGAGYETTLEELRFGPKLHLSAY